MDAPLLSRRDWLSRSCALLAVSALGISRRGGSAIALEELVLNARGGYRFLPARAAFLSSGALAADGFEIVRTTLRRPRPFSQGIAEIERMLQATGRPIHALCGLELRSPGQPSAAEFSAFNQAYVTRLDQAGLLIDGKVPLARTNVASGVREVSIHAFSYTMPLANREPAPAPTFVLSGVTDRSTAARREGADSVAAGNAAPGGAAALADLRLRTESVLAAIDETLRAVGVRWTDVTGVQLYTLRDVQPLLADLILPRLGAAGRLGIEWHHEAPPSARNELEIGVRGIRLELVA